MYKRQEYGSSCVDTNRALCRVSYAGIFIFYDSPPFRGASKPSPGGPFHAPRSPSRSSATVLLPVRQRAAVWDGRRATARPREAKWRSGVAAVFWVDYNKNIFKDPFGHYYRGAFYYKDTLRSTIIRNTSIYTPLYTNNGIVTIYQYVAAVQWAPAFKKDPEKKRGSTLRKK